MRIDELSIGDWGRIYVANEERYCKVDEIRWNNILGKYVCEVCDRTFSLSEAYLHPIPLTPEILEKNGFILDKPSRWHICKVSDDTNINVWIGRKGKGHIEVSRADVFYPECYFKYADIECLYISVHQLQHALRLAGIEKEIKL